MNAASGCYVFSIRAAKGLKPWYVGRTSSKNGFVGECFQPHKREHYGEAFSRTKKGTPILHLIARMTSKGKFAAPNKKETEFAESLMIGMALSQNPELLNKSATAHFRNLTIPGIIGSPGKGGHGPARKSLRKALGIGRK